MPINPNIALQVQPPPPGANPLDSLAKVLQIKNAIAQQPLVDAQVQRAGLENQQLTQQLGATQAMNDSFKDAVKIGADGVPTLDKEAITRGLATKGYGSQIPTVLEHFNTMEKTAGEVAKQKADLAEAEQNYAGAGAAGVKAAGYDPGAATAFLTHAAAIYGPNSPSAQALQIIQQDPSKVQPIMDHLIASSPKQQELTNAGKAAQARVDAAQTGKDRLTAELPGIAAGNTVKQQQATGTQPISPAEQLRLDIEKSNAARAADSAAEARRHNRVDETLGAGRLSVEQTRLAQTTGGVALNPRQESIAQQLAAGDMKPSDLSRYPDKEALRARALEINSNFNDQTYATKKAFADPQSKQSQNLGTISRIVGHIGRFEQNSKQLGVSPSFFTGVNLSGLAGATHEDAHAISSELEKLVSGGVGTEGQVREWQKSLTSSNPTIRQQAVDEISQLIGSQYEGMNQTYKATIGSDLPIEKYVSPAGREWMKAKGINAGAAASPAAPSGGGTVNMKAPDGTVKPVSADQVDHYKKLGATVVP